MKREKILLFILLVLNYVITNCKKEKPNQEVKLPNNYFILLKDQFREHKLDEKRNIFVFEEYPEKHYFLFKISEKNIVTEFWLAKIINEKGTSGDYIDREFLLLDKLVLTKNYSSEKGYYIGRYADLCVNLKTQDNYIFIGFTSPNLRLEKVWLIDYDNEKIVEKNPPDFSYCKMYGSDRIMD